MWIRWTMAVMSPAAVVVLASRANLLVVPV